ncbi:MAG: hypothetical protein K2Y17_12830 [Qipengyuania sp.]|nr:hypothetical protein [Qipengyuania sp.]
MRVDLPLLSPLEGFAGFCPIYGLKFIVSIGISTRVVTLPPLKQLLAIAPTNIALSAGIIPIHSAVNDSRSLFRIFGYIDNLVDDLSRLECGCDDGRANAQWRRISYGILDVADEEVASEAAHTAIVTLA